VCDGQEVTLSKTELDEDFLSSKAIPKENGQKIHIEFVGDTQGVEMALTIGDQPTIKSLSPARFNWGCDARCSIRFEPNEQFGLSLINAEPGADYLKHQSVVDAVDGKTNVPLRGRLYINLNPKSEEGTGILKSSELSPAVEDKTIFSLDCQGDFIKGTDEVPRYEGK
jgi:hypothetical protein